MLGCTNKWAPNYNPMLSLSQTKRWAKRTTESSIQNMYRLLCANGFSKRKMQKRRRELRNMNMGEDVDMAPAEEPPPQHGPFRPLEQPRPLILVSKKEYFVKTDRLVDASVERKVTVKNRDVNAGRNILCIGLYILMVLVIHFQLMGIFLFHFRIVRGHRPTIGSSIHRTSIRRP